MSNRSMLEFNHDCSPRRGDLLAWAEALLDYLRSGNPEALPRGVTWFGMRHHSQDCPLGDPPRGWDNSQKPVEWRRIPGYENYEVSETGQVRRGFRILKARSHPRYHHEQVSIYANGKQWRAGVHHLVALTFHGPAPADKPFACHKNGRAWENHKNNIYWGSRADNVADAKRHASLARVGESVELSNALNVLLGKSNA